MTRHVQVTARIKKILQDADRPMSSVEIATLYNDSYRNGIIPSRVSNICRGRKNFYCVGMEIVGTNKAKVWAI